LLSNDSYLLEGLQSAEKTKMHPKTLPNAPTFTKNGSHSHVSLLVLTNCVNDSRLIPMY